MRAFDEMFRNGITEVRFRKIVAKKIVAMIAKYCARSLLAEDLSSAIWTRTKSTCSRRRSGCPAG